MTSRPAEPPTTRFPGRDTRETRSGTERLVTFTDAVAAIGLTLLALPLVDLVPDALEAHEGIGKLVEERLPQLGAFVLSFLVIFRFWWAHHRVFEHVSRVSRRVVVLSAVWCFGIVFLPVPTAIITAYPPSSATVLVYEGTLVLLSGSLLLIALEARRTPEISEGREPIPDRLISGVAVNAVVLVVALIAGALFPRVINFWALLLLVVAGVVEGIVTRVRRRAAR